MRQDLEWDKVDPLVTEFVLSQAEKYLQTQISTSIAGDQRALTSASIFTTLGGAILAAAIAYWTSERDLAVLIAGVLSGSAAVFGSILCLYAARPVDFYFPGSTPEAWESCLREPLGTSKGIEVENYQERIDYNEDVLARNAKALWWGARVAASSPALGVAVWGVITLSFPAWTVSAPSYPAAAITQSQQPFLNPCQFARP